MRIFALLFFINISSISFSNERVKVLMGGTLIDGFGSHTIKNSVIIIHDDIIREVGSINEIEIPSEAEIISTEGMSILPGLWDMHVHLDINGHTDYSHWHDIYPVIFEDIIMPSSAYQLLLAGVTSVRDCGAPLDEIISVREKIKKNIIPGPNLYVSGPFLQHKPYPNTELYRWGINGVEDAKRKVRKLFNAGVDFIKLIDQDQMTMDELYAVVEESHKLGLKVVAHGHRPEEIRRGLKVGVDCFEHTGLSSAPNYPDDVMSMIKERTAQMNLGPLYWTPTVSPLYNYEYIRDNMEILDNDSWHLGLPDSIVQDIRNSFKHPDRLPYYQLTPSRRPTLENKMNQLLDAGVVLMIGTDSGVPLTFHSQSTWNELEIWVNEFGIDPMYAIRAATYWPSLWMGVSEKVGTITPGKKADIIAVKGDVLRNISILQNIDIILKDGKVIKKPN